MKTDRRHARVIALEILYQKDIVGCSLEQSIDMREKRIPAEIEPIPDFTIHLLENIDKNIDRIDKLITSYADNWVIERMPVIDRNLLRICICEMLFEDDIPHSVSINEAVDLAKIYSTAESSKFVNGVLGQMAQDLKQELKP